jgi:hypothetical protein
LATLAILTEPVAYMTVFGSISRPVEIEEEAFASAVAHYRESLRGLYDSIGNREIRDAHAELCRTAETIDRNGEVHTLLRLGSEDLRMRLRGAVGGALLIKSMAEVIRRAVENYDQIRLPEEDESGFGRWAHGAKRRIYGTDRILDGGRTVAQRVVRQHLLDYSTRLRWYVEGDTEYAALAWILRQFSAGIDLVNLKGQFVAAGGRGVAFRDDLRRDLQNEVLSFISLDGDRDDNIRVVRAAAEADEVSGGFFVCEPDFEFANFTLDELKEVILELAQGQGLTAVTRHALDAVIAGTENSRELISRCNSAFPGFQFAKGSEWGERLGRYAWTSQIGGDQRERPVVEQVKQALRADHVDFRATRQQFRVDPTTGRLIPRE